MASRKVAPEPRKEAVLFDESPECPGAEDSVWKDPGQDGFIEQEASRRKQTLEIHSNQKVLMLSHSWRDPRTQSTKRHLVSGLCASSNVS